MTTPHAIGGRNTEAGHHYATAGNPGGGEGEARESLLQEDHQGTGGGIGRGEKGASSRGLWGGERWVGGLVLENTFWEGGGRQQAREGKGTEDLSIASR